MNSTGSERTGYQWIKYSLLALFIILAIVFAVNFDIQELKVLLDKYEKIGYAICLLAYILLGVTPIPSDPVTILVLSWKGPLIAILIATLGNTIAAIVEYYIGEISAAWRISKKRRNIYRLDSAGFRSTRQHSC